MSFAMWRDIDNESPRVGVTLRPGSVSLYLGRRLYRARWTA